MLFPNPVGGYFLARESGGSGKGWGAGGPGVVRMASEQASQMYPRTAEMLVMSCAMPSGSMMTRE